MNLTKKEIETIKNIKTVDDLMKTQKEEQLAASNLAKLVGYLNDDCELHIYENGGESLIDALNCYDNLRLLSQILDDYNSKYGYVAINALGYLQYDISSEIADFIS
jgi:hypothetical protein